VQVKAAHVGVRGGTPAGVGWPEVELASEGVGLVDEGDEGETAPTGRGVARREELPHRLASTCVRDRAMCSARSSERRVGYWQRGG
jgi:hypothetical protein